MGARRRALERYVKRTVLEWCGGNVGRGAWGTLGCLGNVEWRRFGGMNMLCDVIERSILGLYNKFGLICLECSVGTVEGTLFYHCTALRCAAWA